MNMRTRHYSDRVNASDITSHDVDWQIIVHVRLKNTGIDI